MTKLRQKTLKMRPLHKRVIIKRELETVQRGIIIPDAVKEKTQRGTVVAVPMESQLKKGEHVIFGKYAGSEVKLNGEELLIMNEDEILVVLEGPLNGE